MADTAMVVRALTPDVWRMIQEVAPAAHMCRFFGVASPEQAAVIMLKGFELGLPLAASFEFIHVVEGKASISPRGALALIHQSPLLAGMKITEEKDSCTVWMKRTNGFEHTLTWTMADAIKTGQVRAKGAWEMYPANMLRWRCVGFVADVVFPDVLGGLKRSDEFGADLKPDGSVIEGEWRNVQPQPSAAPQAAPTVPALTLDTLVEQYGAEAVIVANEGAIPATVEDLERVKKILETNAAFDNLENTTNETFAFIGRAPCGCVRASIVDDPAEQKDVGKERARMKRDGLKIERVSLSTLQTVTMHCDEHAPPVSR